MLDIIILGHLVGDYLLQSKKMALEKTEKSFRGIEVCTYHSLYYTVSFFVINLFNKDILHPIISLLLFLSHFFIDRYSLGAKWLKLINGRDFVKEFDSPDKYRDIHLGFAILVYAVVDNTIHLLVAWGLFKIFY